MRKLALVATATTAALLSGCSSQQVAPLPSAERAYLNATPLRGWEYDSRASLPTPVRGWKMSAGHGVRVS